MQRFITSPQEAQSKFSTLAYRIHPFNMRGTFMRGGIRL